MHIFKNTTQALNTFFFVSQTATNALSLPLIYSISSKNVFLKACCRGEAGGSRAPPQKFSDLN